MDFKKIVQSSLFLFALGVFIISGFVTPAYGQSTKAVIELTNRIIKNDLKTDENGKQIIGVVIGDSNTTESYVSSQNWVRLINRKLDRQGNNYTFVNIARDGAMVSDFEEDDVSIDPYLGEAEIAKIEAIGYVPNLVIFLGTNDALMEVPIEEFKSYYNQLVDKVLSLVKVDRLVLVTPSALVPLIITGPDGTTVDVVSELSAQLSRQIKRHIVNIKLNINFVSVIKSHGLRKINVRMLNIDKVGVTEIWDHVHLDINSHVNISRNIDDRLILQ